MKYIWKDGRWMPASWFKASPSRAPMIIRDHQEPIRSMADGRIYDSKSQMRAAYKSLGYIELGNDVITARGRIHDPTIEADVAHAYEMIEQGYRSDPIERIDAGEFANIPLTIYGDK